MATHTESSSGADVPATLQKLNQEPTEPARTTELDQQVNAAVRDVESWLRDGARLRRRSEAEIDWSIPHLVQPYAEQHPDEINDESDNLDEDPAASLEERKLRDSVRIAERRMLEVAKARQQSQNKLLIKLETESKIQADAFARRREEEELRRQAHENAVRRREEDQIKLQTQRKEVRLSERELKTLWDEERRLRSEIAKINQLAHEALLARVREEENAKLALLAEAQRSRDEAEVAHSDNLAKLHHEEEALRRVVARTALRRTEVQAQRQKHDEESRKLEEERTRLATAESARLAERKRIREEAEEKLHFDQDQLSLQEKELARLTQTLSQQRSELEIARQSAEEDARRVTQARARMQAAAESSQQDERERLLLEAEIFQRAEIERHMLEDARSRAEEQQRHLEVTARERTEWHSRKMAELAALRSDGEARGQAYVEKEQMLGGEVESLRLAEQLIMKKIEELETRRRMSSDSHNRMIEKLKRVEEEASARAAHEAETRAEIERRIKEETAQLKRLELEHQQRIEEEIARRAEAEKRLLQEKNRYQGERSARIKTELRIELGTATTAPILADDVYIEAAESEDDFEVPPPDQVFAPETIDGVPVYQVGDLSSPDPKRRAEAVTALARLGSHDAYDLITDCFDDDSSLVRNAAARAMLSLEPVRPAESFTRALKDASPERSVRMGKAIAESGLAAQAINGLCSDNRDETYNSLCLLFTMARTGEVGPLVGAIESHEDAEVRVAAVRLLKMSGLDDLATEAVNRRLRPDRAVTS